MARAPREYVGDAVCPCCKHTVPVKQQANGYAILVCNWCDSKLQTFSAKGDALLRGAMTPVAATPAAPAAPPPRPPNPAQPAVRPGLGGLLEGLGL
ncbi:hypothetical protein [Chitiniphilus eburneus]|uniref:hypothetical protein n=1 Tax=Chitiniphilus eburneus TaxID=2571148 RepID=UPI0035CF689D